MPENFFVDGVADYSITFNASDDFTIRRRAGGVSFRWLVNSWRISHAVKPEFVANRLKCSLDFLDGLIAVIHSLPSREKLIEMAVKYDPRQVWTYFIEAHGLNRVKIGSSRSVTRRLSTLSSMSPVKLELLAVTTCEEQLLHRLFTADRLHGEWFEKTPLLESFISDCRQLNSEELRRIGVIDA